MFVFYDVVAVYISNKSNSPATTIFSVPQENAEGEMEEEARQVRQRQRVQRAQMSDEVFLSVRIYISTVTDVC